MGWWGGSHGEGIGGLTSWLAWIWRRYCMRRSGGPEPCAACSSTSACGTEGGCWGSWQHPATPGSQLQQLPDPGSPSFWNSQSQGVRTLGSPNLRAAQTPSPSGAGVSHRGATETPPTAPQAPFQGVWGHLGSPLPPGGYLYAPDDGVVCPAHVGQGWALHQDFHSLDGTCRAQVIHGHLDSESSVTATLAGQWGARTPPHRHWVPQKALDTPKPSQEQLPPAQRY